MLDYGGETFLDRLIGVLEKISGPVIVVLGYHAAAIRPRVRRPAMFVVNPAPERGQLSSLQTGLAALPLESEGFAFMPIDCPGVSKRTVASLSEAFARRALNTLFTIPQYRGRHGHPVFAARAIAEELLALPPGAQARDVVHRHVDQTQYVDVDDPGILADVDTPEAYRRLIEAAL